MTKSHSKREQYLTVKDLTDWLKVSKSTIYRWVQESNFPKPIVLGAADKKNGVARWVESDVVLWLESRPNKEEK
tara:strand:- start:197 stop:418 length:222 start_codon:yes stop_codon:yes gene_type:complete